MAWRRAMMMVSRRQRSAAPHVVTMDPDAPAFLPGPSVSHRGNGGTRCSGQQDDREKSSHKCSTKIQTEPWLADALSGDKTSKVMSPETNVPSKNTAPLLLLRSLRNLRRGFDRRFLSRFLFDFSDCFRLGRRLSGGLFSGGLWFFRRYVGVGRLGFGGRLARSLGNSFCVSFGLGLWYFGAVLASRRRF